MAAAPSASPNGCASWSKTLPRREAPVQRDARGIIFGPDDTLYPIRRFVLSGFAAVARHLEHTFGLNPHDVFRVLISALGSERGHELQICQKRFGLPPGVIPGLIDVIRGHS